MSPKPSSLLDGPIEVVHAGIDAVAAAPRAARAASALLGALQFGFGAAVAPLVGLGGDRTAVPMAAAMTVAGLGALASFLVADGAERAARRGRCAEASAA